MKKTILLGVDPSFATCGVAIYNTKNKVRKLTLYTGHMTEVVKWLAQNVKMKEVIAIVENPALDKAVFGQWALMKQSINKKNIGAAAAQFNICMNRAQKVGENKAAAKLFLKMLSDKGVPFIEIAPSSRQKAYRRDKKGQIVRKDVTLLRMPTKTTKEQFTKLTGHNINEGNTEHSRDAATLVFDKTIKWAELQVELNRKSEKEPASMPSSSNYNFHILKRKKSG